MTDIDPHHVTLDEALYAIRKEVGPLTRNSEADTGKFTYRYVSLTQLVEKVDPIAWRHGVLIHQTLNLDVLRHELWFNGERVEAYDAILPNPQGTAQGLGSAVTYLRRYCYVTSLGLVADLDDDGAAASVASVASPPPPSPQAERRPSPVPPAARVGGSSEIGELDADF